MQPRAGDGTGQMGREGLEERGGGGDLRFTIYDSGPHHSCVAGEGETARVSV